MLLTPVNVNIKALCVKVHLPCYFVVEKFATSFHMADLWYGLQVRYHTTNHALELLPYYFVVEKFASFHVEDKLQSTYYLYFYRTIPILGGMKPLDQLRINVINEDHSRSIAINLDHFSSIMINLRSNTINFAHLPSLAFSHTHMRSLALTCTHMHSHVLTCAHMHSHVLTCAHMRSHALTCAQMCSNALFTCAHTLSDDV